MEGADDRERHLLHKLTAIRAEVVQARALRETRPRAADLGDLSLATKAARAAKNSLPKPLLPRPDRPALDAFFERKPLTESAELGSFVEWDEAGNRNKTLTRMPRMSEMRHKMKMGELGAPLSAQQMMPTDELKRQAFAQMSVARNAAAVAKRRAIFVPVATELKATRLVDPKLADALRTLKQHVSRVDKEREIVLELSRQAKTTSREHGSFWARQQPQAISTAAGSSGGAL